MTQGWDDSAMRAAINARIDAMLADAAAGVRDGMEHVLAESSKVVPLEEGPLQDSGRTAVKAEPGRIVGAVGYGTGAAAAYSIPQHENTTYRHDDGRHAKYLEVPLVANADTVMDLVKRRVR